MRFGIPGQAAGRVIRTNEDRGIILLLDERFLQSEYRNLYPREWICSLHDVQNYVSEFWNTIPEQKDR